MTTEYEAALNAVREATRKFDLVSRAYRARTVGDVEFLAAKAEYDEAGKVFDAAFAKRSERLIEALAESGFEVKPYSGRGMYGKRCVSVYDASAWDIAKALFSEQYDGEFRSLGHPSQDSMGLGSVLYWPSYPWPEGE